MPLPLKSHWLLIGSLGFYAYATFHRPIFLVVLIGLIAVNYFLGYVIHEIKAHASLALWSGILCNLGVLIYFSYFPPGGVSPLGIRFYTLHNLAYLLDVYTGYIRPEYSIFRYATYIVMFPKLPAGPISLYSDLERFLESQRISFKNLSAGVKFFLFGLFIKIGIADRLGDLWFRLQSIGFDVLSTQLAWFGALARSLQIYLDFFGYSIMAAGIAAMMGIRLPRNFSYPYLTLTVTDFVKRFHISLSRWMREYIYLPLGGNRRGILYTCINILAVWLFVGLWHMPGLNFLLWALLLCSLMLLEKFFFGSFLKKLVPLGIIYMFFVIPLTWIVFSVPEFGRMKLYLAAMFPFFSPGRAVPFPTDYVGYLFSYGLFFLLGIVFSTKLPYTLFNRFKDTLVGEIVLLLLFVLSAGLIYFGKNFPFIF